MAKFFQVGGCVRDSIIGIPSKDIDFSVEAKSFDAMRQAIVERGGEIFLESPQHFTIRAKVPSLGAADFVLCRKDGTYSDGRHPDSVEIGTLEDDLARRDFTMNAIAKDESGTLIDPFGGVADIQEQVIRCVGSASKRFSEDSLRLLRAVRFSITKGFRLHPTVVECLEEMGSRLDGVSVERIREELLKCFEFDTFQTLEVLAKFASLREACFVGGRLFLKPTIRG